MYGVHLEMMSKIDELDAMVGECDRVVGFDEKLEELRQLVNKAWNQRPESVGGMSFSPD
jgi:hypothetical protein